MILLESRKNALTIPASALIRQGDAFKVLTIADAKGNPPTGTVREAKIRIGLDDGQRIEV